MGKRLSKIVTRTGDSGTTGLGNGSRVPKNHPRIAAMGDLDELNSCLGVLRTHVLPVEIEGALSDIQQQLFDIGAALCLPENGTFPERPVRQLENLIESLNASLPPLQEFILPAGPHGAAACHLARAVCRRTERQLVTLAAAEAVNEHILSYINRLSDLLFIIARILARQTTNREAQWQPARGDHQAE